MKSIPKARLSKRLSFRISNLTEGCFEFDIKNSLNEKRPHNRNEERTAHEEDA